MKNKILLNNNSRNHIKFMPCTNKLDIPQDEKNQIIWCQEKFAELELNGVELNHYSSRKKGILLSVYELNDLYYLVQCLRNEQEGIFYAKTSKTKDIKIYNTTIYILESKNDASSIWEFLRKNNSEVMNDYKELMIDARNGEKPE